MSAPPYMPLYVGDYLADTTHLTCTEHGAYMLLLMAMWRSGGALPNDDAKLARFARCTRAQWDRIRPTLMEFFDATDGELTQGRMARELTKHSSAVEQRRMAGSNGGKAKALKDRATPLAGAMPSPCQPEPEPEPEEKIATLNRREHEGGDPSEIVWPPSVPSRKAELDALEALLRSEASPGIDQTATAVCVLTAILNLGNPAQGPPCDLYADVLPVIRGKAKSARPGSIRSWSFFVPACIEARDRRLQALPNVENLDVRRAPHQPPGPSAKLLAREANYARAFAAPSRVAER